MSIASLETGRSHRPAQRPPIGVSVFGRNASITNGLSRGLEDPLRGHGRLMGRQSPCSRPLWAWAIVLKRRSSPRDTWNLASGTCKCRACQLRWSLDGVTAVFMTHAPHSSPCSRSPTSSASSLTVAISFESRCRGRACVEGSRGLRRPCLEGLLPALVSNSF